MVPDTSVHRALSCIPAISVTIVYFIFLGHRHDYPGHFAAGYGMTLCVIAIALTLIPGDRFARLGTPTVPLCTLLCIAAGTLAEATVFCLAKFDEVDYCNQNLGAILAGIVSLRIAQSSRPPDSLTRWMIAWGALFVMAGGWFAVH